MNVFNSFHSNITSYVSIPEANGITNITTDISYTTFLSGSKTYYYFEFTDTTKMHQLFFSNISGGNVLLHILAVGGGGGGGGGLRQQYGSGGGGGGAGAVGIGKYSLNTGYDVSFNVTIGKGGNPHATGGDTTISIIKNGIIQNLIAHGGALGQWQHEGNSSVSNGVNGSSGGGSANGRSPGNGTNYTDSILTYYGHNGGVAPGGALWGGGGGGGAGGTGRNGSYPFGGGAGGIGLSVDVPGIPPNIYGVGGSGGGGGEGSFPSGAGSGGGGGGGGSNNTNNSAPGVQGTVIISINAASVNNIYYTN